jgi:hypothetical protein
VGSTERIVVVKDAVEARSLAERYLSELQTSPPAELVIFDEQTIETDFGWVFFWNSKKYRETGEFRDTLAGNRPLIVDRRDGSVHNTPIAYSVEQNLENYRANRQP